VALPGLGPNQGGSTGQVTQLGLPVAFGAALARRRSQCGNRGGRRARHRAAPQRRSAKHGRRLACDGPRHAALSACRATGHRTAPSLHTSPSFASHKDECRHLGSASSSAAQFRNKAYKAMKCTRAVSKCKSLEALAAAVHCWRAHKPRLLHESLQGRRVVHALPATHRLSLPCGGAATETPPCQRSAQADPSEILTEGRKRWRTAGPSERPVSGGSWCSACSMSIGRAASARAAAECARAATKCGGPCRCPAEGAALAVRRPRSARGLLALLQTPAGQGAAAAAAAGAVAKPGWTLAQQRAPGDGSMKRCGWQR